MPTVTIVIPVAQTPLLFLGQCLESVARQTYKQDLEVIIAIDNPNLNYVSVATEMLYKVEGVSHKILHSNSQRGVWTARNDAISVAQGDYIFMLDSDDQLEDEAIEKCLPYLLSWPKLATTDFVRMSADMQSEVCQYDKGVYQSLMADFGGSIFDPMLHANLVYHSQIYQRQPVLQLGGFRTDLSGAEEIELQLRLTELSPDDRIVLIPECVYRYRDNPHSLTHNQGFFSKWINGIEQTLVQAAQRRGFDVRRADRIGPAKPSNMDHYVLYSSNETIIKCPYFDYSTSSIKQEYKNGGRCFQWIWSLLQER